MKNFLKLIFITLLFLSFIKPALSEKINKIKIIGNERISDETVIVYGDIKKDLDYQPSDINLLIKKLFDTKFFSDIKINLENGVLNIEVVENPTINLIIFKGIKAEKYKKAIMSFLELREKTPYIKNVVTKDVDLIKGYYRQLGYYFVKIDAEIQELKKNRINLIYSIDTGEKAKIAKIFFLGDKKVRNLRLYDIITSQENKFWKVLSRNVYLNEQRVELDKRLLTNYYKNKGYYEVEVSSSNVEYVEGEGFILTFSIDAGKRYRFGKVYANISKKLNKEQFFSLDDEFKKISGEYYSRKKLINILEKIDELAESKELQFINHRLTETLDGDKVIVKIDVMEGSKVFLERVNIFGNSITNESVIRGELIVDEGDPYSVLLVNKSINRLKSRNIFGNVSQKIIPGSDPNNKILEISVEEKATGELGAGAGIGTEGTSFSFFVKENNWLGRGVQVQGSLDVSEESLRGGLNVNNPNYNFTGRSVSAGISSTKVDKLTKSGYESSKNSASLGTSFEQYKDIYLSPNISMSYEDVSTDASASTSLKKQDGTYTNVDFGYGIALDKRNQSFQPTEGYRFQFNQRLPIFSDNATIVNGINLSRYKSFTEDIVSAVKIYASTVNSIDPNEDVRITDRIYLPGRKLRGFESGKVGPKDGDDFIGGNYAAAVNFEAALPNLLPEETKTDVMLFWDFANLWGVDYDKSLSNSSSIRSSIGASADVFTPVGPLSLTFAHTLNKASTDKTQTFKFNLGTSF